MKTTGTFTAISMALSVCITNQGWTIYKTVKNNINNFIITEERKVIPQ